MNATENITMTNEDFKDLINNQEDSELWTRSILGKKFNHLISKGIEEGWLILNNQYVKVA